MYLGNRQYRRWLVYASIILVFIYMCTWTYPSGTFYTPRDSKINELNYGYTISPRVCSSTYNPSLIVIVLSTVKAVAQRTAIRETWGSVSRTSHWPNRQVFSSVKVIFLFGLSRNSTLDNRLQYEAKEFGDILQIGLTEAYGLNVTRKLLSGFKWVHEQCPNTRHILKADDDVFVDMPLVMERLQSPEWSPYMCGHVVLLAFTIRSGKYHLTYTEYPYLLIPRYILGYFYVMPMDAAYKLVQASEYIPYLRMEDVYVTAILSRVIGLQIKGYQTYLSDVDRSEKIDICDFVSGKRDVSVNVSPEKMHAVWNKYKYSRVCLSSENRLVYLKENQTL